MEKIEWHIKNQNAKYKFSENLSKETSINISKEIFDFLGAKQSGDIITVTLRKKDFLLAFSKLISNLPLYYYRNGSQKADFNSEFFDTNYTEIEEHFGTNERINYKVKLRINDESTTRYYLYRVDGAKNFILRDFLIGENSILNFIKTDNGEFIIEPVIVITKKDDYLRQDNEPDNSVTNISPTQIIYYGVPGSGKSHEINNILKKEITNDKDREFQVCRVVFHPEYTNADFVGQVLPRVKGGDIKYEFKPGPFAKILYRALHNLNKKFFLVIEEINRGNAAAIFGDIFQLLDRIESVNDTETIGSNTFGIGWSKYFIENDYINNYIRSKVEYSDEVYTEEHGNKEISLGENIIFSANTSLRLPPNLSLYATMNTSDQNVFTLDNAFQRRWDMQLVPNECTDTNQMNATITVNKQKITWEDFQETINAVIGEKSNEGGLSSMEDKRLGCWFVKAENGKIKANVFADKVLKYLWDDAFKFYHQEVFKGDIKNFEELHRRFLVEGFSVFSDVCRLGEKLQSAENSTDSESDPE